ncbi:C39 family peptidase [Oceanimonas sp. CAM02]|uniref:C39 family peptidase n=1 Tax=Oceanimonas sp. CAM02 TaxID=3080336 RepID=UPI0029359401|nr:C39 family peptidase [Oceanimonas sp. CAM02]MDV2857271.1 C39 family peptidase [Oceanimonas sp. CAM02]
MHLALATSNAIMAPVNTGAFLFFREGIKVLKSYLLIGVLLSIPSHASSIDMTGTVPGIGTSSKKVVSIADRKFLGVVKQQTDFSCGAASVATILKYSYNMHTNEKWVLDGMLAMANPDQVAQFGFSMLDMKNYVEMLGMEAKGFKIKDKEIVKLKIPSIVLLDIKGFQHFVVIKKVDSENRVYLADPALGNKIVEMDEFLAGWNNIVLAIIGKDYDKYSILANPAPPLTARGRDNRFVPVSDAALMEFGFNYKDLL